MHETPPLHVAFVVGTDPFDICNRRSAIGSFLCGVLTQLRHRYAFTVNGMPFEPCATAQPSESAGDSHRLPARLGRQLLPRRLKEALKEPRVFRLQARLTRRLITDLVEPHLVFELYRYGSRVGMNVANRWGCPYVVFCDAPEVLQYHDVQGFPGWLSHRARVNEMDSLRAADAVIVYSENIKKRLTDAIGLDPARCRVFQTLDYSRLTRGAHRPSGNAPTIGYIGSFMPWHNVSQLVAAFEKIRDGAIDVKLLLVGTGMCHDIVARQVATSRWRQDIEMTGFLDGPPLEHVKARIDIGVLPGTTWYNLPTKIFEYGAAGVATIAPKSPTVLELFSHQETILAFDEGSTDSLAEALRTMASDRVLRDRLAHQLQTRILAEYTSARMENFYCGLFDSLLGNTTLSTSSHMADRRR